VKGSTGDLATDSILPLQDTGRVRIEDKEIVSDLSDVAVSNHLLVRVVARRRRFIRTDFKYSIFDTGYFRDCSFDSCDFTGCRFTGTSFAGSKFSGCKFDYAVFERTLIDSSLLDTECPALENLKMRFARTLRLNYQQIGDAKSANRAIEIELQATRAHLQKACRSPESYYRHKYKGPTRVRMYLEWSIFVLLDWIWGNGESILKLSRAILLVLGAIALIEVLFFKNPYSVLDYVGSLGAAPQVFFGVLAPKYYASWYLTMIVFVRLIAFAFFMSITIKRLNRR
jgi:hypothetical protein